MEAWYKSHEVITFWHEAMLKLRGKKKVMLSNNY